MNNFISSILLCSLSTFLIGQGETCNNAELVIVNNTYMADGPATGAGCFNCSDFAVNADWYVFTPAMDGFASVSSCDNPLGTDTRFWVYSGDCFGLSLVAENDDANCGIGTTFASYTEFPVSAGMEYFIEWDDNWTSDSFLWRLQFTECPMISDLTINATATTSADISWTTSIPSNLTTLEYGSPGFSLGSGTVQYSSNGMAMISGLTIDTDYQLYVFETCADTTSSNTLDILFSTDSLPPPDNDDCIDSLPLMCGESIDGTTQFANVSQDGVFCGTTTDAAGIWYSIVGDGTLMQASTCDMADYDSKITVFTGTCDSLICVDGNDDDPSCIGNTSIVEWESIPGEIYFILVHGFNGSVGNFTLEISCITCPQPSISVLDINDNSITIDWAPATANSNFILEYGLGGFVPGTGTTLNGITGTDGPPYMITGLDPITNYSFYILQDCGVDGLSDTSNVVDFTTDDIPPLNDLCEEAFILGCDTIVSGVTTFANIDTLAAPDCGSVTIVTNGVWYQIEGTGGLITASTCNMAAYDTKISVYTGECGDMDCIVANDDAVAPDGTDCGGFSSIAQWNSVAGTSYFILVHGYGTFSVGSFNMEVTCSEPCTPIPDNQVCAEAISVNLSTTDSCSYFSSTNVCSSANLNNPSCDSFGVIQDVWYSFNTGANNEVLIDLVLTTASNGSFAIYEGCDSTEIYCSNDILGPELITDLTLETDYLLQFWNGGNAEEGEFDLCISADSTNVMSSVNDPILNDISIYPNPANNILIIDVKEHSQVKFTAFDMRGIRVEQRILNLHKNTLDIGTWSNGLYTLSFEKKNMRSIKKLAKH